jgi:hypothetical protein
MENHPTLADTPLKTAIDYYVTHRNCAPVSKNCLVSTLNANVPDFKTGAINRSATSPLTEMAARLLF